MSRERRKDTELTSLQLRDVLDKYLDKFHETQEINPSSILEAWPLIIGERLAKMTKAVVFSAGVLIVKVNNSTLYSLLTQHEKQKLIQALKARFPKVEIKTITFRIG